MIRHAGDGQVERSRTREARMATMARRREREVKRATRSKARKRTASARQVLAA